MKKNYKKIVATCLFLFTILSIQAQNITLSIENAVITNDGLDDFYEADIMISSTTDYIQGSGQFYLDYNTAAFGSNIAASGSIIYDRTSGSILGSQFASVDSYNSFIVNDNTPSKVSYLWQQFWGAFAIGSNNVISTSTLLVHIKIKYVDASQSANICFDITGSFSDQFFTACGPVASVAGADCVSSPGTQLLNYTPDCTNSEPNVLSNNDLGNLSENKLGLNIYPNPSSNTFSVSGLKTASKLSVYSISGKEVISVSGYSEGAINVSSLTSGIYLVSIESENSKEVKRLVIK
jgi:hypothetical protein